MKFRQFGLSHVILFVLLIGCAMGWGFERWKYLNSIDQRRKLQAGYAELEHEYAVRSRHYIMLYEIFETQTGSILGYQMMPKGQPYDDMKDHIIESFEDDRDDIDLTEQLKKRPKKAELKD